MSSLLNDIGLQNEWQHVVINNLLDYKIASTTKENYQNIFSELTNWSDLIIKPDIFVVEVWFVHIWATSLLKVYVVVNVMCSASFVNAYAALRPRGGFSYLHQEHMKNTYILTIRLLIINSLILFLSQN